MSTHADDSMSSGRSGEAPGAPLGGTRVRLAPDLAVIAERSPELDTALREVFGAMTEEISAGEPAPRTLHLAVATSHHGGRTLLVDDVPILRIPDPSALAPTLEAMLVGWTVRTRESRAALHAASVELGGSGVLLVGDKGSGKSTLSLVLAGEGARYLGDEVCFVRYDEPAPGHGPIAEAFPKSVTLKAGAFGAFPETTTHEDPIRGPVRYHLPLHRARSARHHVELGLVVFPRWVQGAKTVLLTELDPAEVSLRLVMQSFGGLERDPRMLGLVARLAALPAWEIEYPDGTSAALALRRLVERTVVVKTPPPTLARAVGENGEDLELAGQAG